MATVARAMLIKAKMIIVFPFDCAGVIPNVCIYNSSIREIRNGIQKIDQSILKRSRANSAVTGGNKSSAI